MRYVYLTNGQLGYEIVRWLVEQGDRPAGLVVHPAERSKYREEIIEAVGLPPEQVLEAPALKTDTGIAWLKSQQPDWMISIMFGYILKPASLAIPRFGTLNLHPALLPYNRGAYPNVWSIVDRTPAGATIHYVDPGIDTGDIVAQCEIPVHETDTGASLYLKQEQAALALFQETWPMIRANALEPGRQTGTGTFHRVADTERIDCVDPDKMYRAGDLIDILRARTFPPYKGAYLDLPDRRVYLRLELSEE